MRRLLFGQPGRRAVRCNLDSWLREHGRPGHRVAAQIVTGMGFLGAGAILYERNSVHSLTTASLWVTVAVGVGMVLMSLATAIPVFLLLRFGPRPRFKDSDSEPE